MGLLEGMICLFDRDSAFTVGSWWQLETQVKQELATSNAIRECAPDVLLASQFCWGSIVAAERFGLPICLLGFATYLWPRVDAISQGVSRSGIEERQLDRFLGMTKSFNELRSVYGLPMEHGSVLGSRIMGDRLYVQSVATLERKADLLPPPVRLVGSCVWDPPALLSEQAPEVLGWLGGKLHSEALLAYVNPGRSFGSSNFWYRLCKEVDGDSRLVLAASTSRLDVPTRSVPANMMARDGLLQGAVLPHASVVLSSGNTTAVLGGLLFGLPLLLVPIGNEQPDVAEVCRRRGAARVIFPELLGVESLAKNLLDVASDYDVLAAARSIAIELGRVDGRHVISDDLTSLC